jgi:hypothetical protein
MTLLHVLKTLRRFHAMSACSCLVSGSFHPPQSVLFNFHSRYYCAIGLGSYLGLEVCASHIHARYPTHATPDTPLSRAITTTGLSPFLALHSRRPRLFALGKCRVQTPHLPRISTRDSVCPVPFSIAFTHGISIDFFSCGY